MYHLEAYTNILIGEFKWNINEMDSHLANDH